MTERTFILLTGDWYADQTAEWPALPYAINNTEVLLITNGSTPSDPAGASLKLTHDDAALATLYTLPTGEKRKTLNITGGLVTPADVRRGVIVTNGGGASYGVVWLTAETSEAETDEGGWVILTAGMLQSRFSRPVYDMLTGSLIKQGLADPCPQILSDVTQRVRQAIRSGGRTGLGPAGTIPASERIWALKRAAADLYGSTNDILPHLSKVAREEADKAETHWERIEEGKLTPETPTTTTETAAGNAGSAAINKPCVKPDFNGL